MIPRVLHQIWIGPHPAPSEMMKTWESKHPDWQYKLWTDETGWKNQAQIDAMPEWNGKADIMRYEILEREGGICLDADSTCVLALDDSFLNHDSFACFENETVRPDLIATGYMGASKGNALMKKCVDAIPGRQLKGVRAWQSVGPQFFTEMARGYIPLHVYPSRVFIPKHFTGAIAPGSHTIHAEQHWGSTVGYDKLGSSAGKWNRFYEGVTEKQAYGDPLTYTKGAEFLDGLSVEDWGCGLGWMRNFVKGSYLGIDGSKSPFADKIEDLSTYKSKTEGLFMRHVLEHDWQWKRILDNALESFTRRMVLVLFTPLLSNTQNLTGVEDIPEIAFGKEDIIGPLSPYLVQQESLKTATRYGIEHVFYLEKGSS